MEKNGQIKAKVALITGSTRGIGLEIALNLLNKGYIVVCNSRKEYGELDLNFKGLYEEWQPLEYIKGNVFIESDVEHICQVIDKKYGRLDVLVNNAGCKFKKAFIKNTRSDMENCVQHNLYPALLCSKYALRMMLLHKYGRIINISSIAGTHGLAFEAVYSAAKSALVGFSKAIAKEYGAKGITCNVIAPGVVNSDQLDIDDKEHGRLVDQIIMRRLGNTMDVADLAAYIASEGSSYLTGQVIEIEGGLFI